MAGLVTFIGIALRPFLIANEVKSKRSLPLKLWQPFGNEDSNYWAYYVIDMLYVADAAFIVIGHDLLYTEFILFACHQFDILEKRLQLLSAIASLPKNNKTKFSMENHIISKIKKHHQLIFE